MSIFNELALDGEKIETFLVNLVNGGKKLQALFTSLSPKTLAAASAVFYDVVKTVASAESAASSAASGNLAGAVTLSETTFSLVQGLVADAKSGEAVIVADFKALEIAI